MEAVKSSVIDWGAATQPLGDNVYSGDAFAIKELREGVLVAVIDGLGHGEDAAEAARIAVAVIMSSESDDLFQIVRDCHGALTGTRGVVMSLAFINAGNKTMTWMGVGNVEGRLERADTDTSPSHEDMFLRSGVVGYQLPPLRSAVLSIAPGDMLFLTTDGISGGFAEEVNIANSPQKIADRIIAKYAKKSDDALALVVRYTG